MGVTVATTRVAANTSTGNQTISTTDLGGLTPKAVILIATRGVTDGTAVDGAGFYMGMSDGSNELAEVYESEHAQASMDTKYDQDTTANRILTIQDGTADGVAEGTADWVSFQADGVTIDWTDAPASAFLITAIFFAGTDLSVNVGSVALGNTADALIAVTSVGFEADVLITMMLEGTAVQQGHVGLGVVHNDRAGAVTQRAVTFANRNSFASAQVATVMREGSCLVKNQAGGSIDFYGDAQTFDSSGFDVQLGNARSPANNHLGWLALRFGASAVVSSKVYTYSTPTATGSNTDAGAGFEPQFVMYLSTRTAVAGTVETDADSGSIGLVVVDADDLYTQSISDEDGAADSNTQSLSDDALNLPTHTGGAGQVASFTSFGGTGVTWNWSTVDATARQWAGLAIGINSSSALSVTKSDSIAVTESTSVQTSEPSPSVQDSVAVSEAVSRLLISYVSAGENVSLAEAVAMLLQSYVAVSDSVTLSEFVALAISNEQITVQDTVSVSEAVQRLLISYVTKNDNVSLSEAVTMLLQSFVTVSDNVAVAEAIALSVGLNIGVQDSVVVSESVTLTVVTAGTLTVTVSDSVTLTENVERLLTSFVNVSDTISTTESVSGDVGILITVSDSVSVSESVVLAFNALALSVSEGISLSEAVGVLIPGSDLSVLVIDSLLVSESVGVLKMERTSRFFKMFVVPHGRNDPFRG